jgi:hypothetical protein
MSIMYYRLIGSIISSRYVDHSSYLLLFTCKDLGGTLSIMKMPKLSWTRCLPRYVDHGLYLLLFTCKDFVDHESKYI